MTVWNTILSLQKENFHSNPTFRLTNSTKTNLGSVSKEILERIIGEIKDKTNLNQWKSTHDVIDWFKNLGTLKKARFLKFDIQEFYPSISPELLDRALSYAKTITHISQEEENIIHLAKETLLFSNEKCWVKKTETNFDVTMGSFDGAETVELVGIYLLNKIKDIIPQQHNGLYRDDGLAAIVDANGPKMDRIRKRLHELFKTEGLKITVELYKEVANYLDTELNLKYRSYKPFKKENDTPLYIHTKSNHPRNIIKSIPNMIYTRLSNISSDEGSFNEIKHEYQLALTKSGFQENLKYQKPNLTPKSRQRKRKIVWFNPPFSSNVSTNIGKKFFSLIEKHFPKNNPLHKVINSNTIKISYSCMPNLQKIIKGHNKSVLATKQNNEIINMCNCVEKDKCPLNGNCLETSTVYMGKVNITRTGQIHKYIGISEPPFKSRWLDHNKTFSHERYRSSTELSKLIWDLKDKNIEFSIDWQIISKCNSYKAGLKSCNLCDTEKLYILKNPDCINKKSELISKCRHKRKFLIKFYT